MSKNQQLKIALETFFLKLFSRLGYIIILWMVLFVTMYYFLNFENIPYRLMWSIGLVATIIILSLGRNIANNAFIIILTFGLFYSFTMPIQDNPDENAHLARSLYLSEGNFGMSDRPEELMISQDYELIKAQEGENGEILKEYSHSKEKVPVEIITATSTNLFVSYLPQALGLKIGRLIGLNLYWTYFLGRIFNLIAYAFLVKKAIYLSNNWQLPITFIALTPMCLFLAASYNQDSVAIGVIFLTIGYFLHMMDKEKLNKKNYLIYSLLCALVGTLKLPYVALIGLLVFIPIKKFNSKKDLLWIYISIGLVGITTLLWLLSYLNITPVHKPINADTILQLKFLLKNPTVVLELIVNVIFKNIENYTMMFRFGWLSYGSLEVALVHLFFFGAITFLYPVKKNLPKVTKFGVMFISLLIFILINLSQYLTWTDVGLNYVSGVQGRYFIGVFAIMPVAFNLNRYFKIEGHSEGTIDNEKQILFIHSAAMYFIVAMLSCQIGQYIGIFS